MIFRNIVKRCFSTSLVLRAQTDPCKIGMREIVGFGINGQSMYSDNLSFPYPAIRFREITPEYKALKEKEKGDWRSLTIAEKKMLYRVSFCETFAEMNAPTGRWKVIIGSTLMVFSASLMLFLFIRMTCLVPLPDSFSQFSREEQLKRMLNLQMNPITGISSKYYFDKETESWVKK